MITFTHSGKLGDLIYSLNFCLELVQHFNVETFNFHIQTNVKYQNSYVGEQGIIFSSEEAQFIEPLLKAQPYINLVSYGDLVPVKSIHLDKFNKQPLNYYAGDIRNYYYSLSNTMLPREFWKQILTVNPNPKFKDKILLTLSQRYVNCNIQFKQLQQFKDKLVFIGTEQEHNTFCKNWFNIQFAGRVNSLLEVAELIAGAKGYISNQTGFFAVAEGLKVNRGLITADHIIVQNKKQLGPVNVLPLGGNCSTIQSTQKLIDSTNFLLNCG